MKDAFRQKVPSILVALADPSANAGCQCPHERTTYSREGRDRCRVHDLPVSVTLHLDAGPNISSESEATSTRKLPLPRSVDQCRWRIQKRHSPHPDLPRAPAVF